MIRMALDSPPTTTAPSAKRAVALPRNSDPLGTALSLVVWGAVVLLSPIYVFPSGIPQPADWLFLFLLGYLFITNRLTIPREMFQQVGLLGAFVGYIVIVNLGWTAVLMSSRSTAVFTQYELLVYSAYYVFNFLAALAVLAMFRWQGSRFVNVTVAAILLSTMIQTVAAWLGGVAEDGTRTTAFFENPNQLGYYAVLCASLLLVCSKSPLTSPILRLLSSAAFVALLYLAVMSSSRAGIVAVAICFLIMQVTNWRMAGLTLLALGVLAVSGIWSDSAQAFLARSQEKRSSFWDEIAYRGYDRIWNHPQYLLFGAGEGDYDRFNSALEFELHSTFGTILFCYGAIGSVLFLLTFRAMVRRNGLRALLYLAPVAAYGFTHQGLRQSELWWLIILIACLIVPRRHWLESAPDPSPLPTPSR